jgi:hypothetical protein
MPEKNLLYTSLTPSFFIEVPELSQEGSFVLGISNLRISTIFLLNVGTVPTVWYIYPFYLIQLSNILDLLTFTLLLLCRYLCYGGSLWKKDKTTNNDLQNTKQKTKDRVTEAKVIPLTHGLFLLRFIFRFWNGSESVIYLPILFNTIVKYIRFIDIYVNSVMSISLLWWIISPRGYHPFPIVMYQWSAEGWSFSPGTPVCSTNKTDRHDITEMLLKVN